jgi:polyhydroxybutyrate depolymerase
VLALTTIAAGAPASLAQPTPTPAASYDARLLHDGVRRHYQVYAPGFVGTETERPLVLVLHGTGGTGPGVRRLTRFDRAATALGLIVAFPTGTDISGKCCDWNDHRPSHVGPDDVGFLDAVIEAVASRHRVAPDQIYVAGLSNGGLMTIRLACERTGTYAAFATVGATLTTSLLAHGCDPRPKRMLLINGDADPLVPYKGGPMPTPGDGVGIGARKTRNYFARQYGCEPVWTAVHSNPDPRDHTEVMEYTAAPCNGRPVDVTHVRIHRGGHTWPNERDPTWWWSMVAGPTTRDFDGAFKVGQWFLEH